MTDLEHRLRTAVHTHTADVVPDDRRSLDAIRTRVRTARRRRRAALAGATVAAIAAVAVALPRLDDDGDAVFTGPDRETSTTTSPPTTGPPEPPAPRTALDQALWPVPGDEVFADPVDAARSFVENVVGAEDPPLSAYHAGEPGAGEVDVFGRGEDGRRLDRVVGTVVVRQLDGEHWFVTAAGSSDVQIDGPEPLERVTSPVHVSGRGRGYEGTIVVELWARSRPPALLADAVTIAGGADALAPFAVDLDAGEASEARGAAILLAKDSPGADLAVPSFAALPVELELQGG
jgi:hypothetical protein